MVSSNMRNPNMHFSVSALCTSQPCHMQEMPNKTKENKEMKYRKKPEIVDAVQWFKMGDHEAVQQSNLNSDMCFFCKLPLKDHGYFLNGREYICPGDWVITDSHGDNSVSDNETFQENYEAVE